MKGNSLFVFISNIQTVSKGSKVYFFPKIIDFFEIEVYGQTVLSDSSILIFNMIKIGRKSNSIRFSFWTKKMDLSNSMRP